MAQGRKLALGSTYFLRPKQLQQGTFLEWHIQHAVHCTGVLWWWVWGAEKHKLLDLGFRCEWPWLLHLDVRAMRTEVWMVHALSTVSLGCHHWRWHCLPQWQAPAMLLPLTQAHFQWPENHSPSTSQSQHLYTPWGDLKTHQSGLVWHSPPYQSKLDTYPCCA